MTLPLVSIVVCTHNRADSLRAAVASLYDLQTHGRFGYEIVVIDNASSDQTPEAIATAARECRHVVRGVYEGRKGISFARNRGVQEAAGQWIAFFDDDQLAEPQWLAALVEMAEEKNAAGVGGPVILQLPAGCTRTLAEPCRMLLGESDWSDQPIRYDDHRTPGAGNLLLRRDVFNQIGLFDEGIGSRGEDTELYRRMQRYGLPVWYAPQAVIWHVIPASRLEDAYLLSLARRMGEGVARYEAASHSRAKLLCRWAAKRTRALIWFRTRAWFAQLRGRPEQALGYRCLMAVSAGYHAEAGQLLFPPGESLPSVGISDCGALVMKFSVLKPHELTSALVAQWDQIQSEHAQFGSPYFRPEFTQAVAAVRPRVEIAVLEDAGRPVGFFPYERCGWNGARPVGGRMSDFHAVIVRPDCEWSAAELLRGCSLSGWRFDHLLAGQQQFAGFHAASEDSIYLDLSQGFDAYRAARRKAGSDKINQVFQSYRKVERELGPIRFEPIVEDEAVFSWLLASKSQQYQRTGLADLFRFPWAVELLRRIWAQPDNAFRGVLSALYFGDELAAAHFGMRSGSVLHSWFPAYNQAFARFSPGLMLNVVMARDFANLGITRIDLGKGDEPYKLHFRSAADPVAEGMVSRHPWSHAIHSRLHSARVWARRLPVKRQLQTPLRWYRQFRDWFTIA